MAPYSKFQALSVLFIILKVATKTEANANVQLTRIENQLTKVLEHIKEQDEFQGIKEMLNIDTTLKKIQQQNEDIIKQLSTARGRSGGGIDDVQTLEIRIDSMENNVVSNVRGGIKKMDDVSKQTDAIKSEMEKRLGKMMNLMTTVYQLNEKISSKVEQGGGGGNSENGESQSIFMFERMDSLEKTVSESVSIMRETLMSEIRTIKLDLLEPFSECRELTEQVEDMKKTCESLPQPELTRDPKGQNWQVNKENLVQDITESVMKNITRVQREINEKIDKKLQDLESRMETKTTLKPNLYFTPTTTPKTGNPPHESKSLQGLTEVDKKEPRNCNTLRYAVPTPKNCEELKQAGASCNGPYIIYPKGDKAVYAYCDMVKDGGGWTVITRRGEFGGPNVNFNQNWKGYKEGFGDINGEFWLGNDNIRMLTSGQDSMVLQVTLESFDGSQLDLTYDQFWIESEENHYRLHLGNVNRSATYQGSSLRHHNGRPFSTHDQNNDDAVGGSQDCAARFRAGWWYNRCHYALLTAPYFKQGDMRHKWQGIQWHAWKGNEALKSAEMKIKPKTTF